MRENSNERNLIIYKIHLNAPRVVKVHHEEHQVNEPLAIDLTEEKLSMSDERKKGNT